MKYFLLILLFINSFFLIDLKGNERHSNRVIGEFVEKMKKRGLKPSGFGGSGDVNMHATIAVMFQTDEKMTIDSARKLILDVTNEFLWSINNDKKLRPYLVKFPATVENVNIVIYSNAEATKEDDYISSVMTIRNYLHYDNDLPDPIKSIVHKETFQEAMQIVAKEQP